MRLPAVFSDIVTQHLPEVGDFMKVERTKTNRIVATAKTGGVKLSRVVYPTVSVVETKSYKIK